MDRTLEQLMRISNDVFLSLSAQTTRIPSITAARASLVVKGTQNRQQPSDSAGSGVTFRRRMAYCLGCWDVRYTNQ